MVIVRGRKDLKPYLLDPRGEGIAEPYFLIKVDEQVILIVSAGLNGLEFNKTEVFLASFLGVQLYQCLYGQGLLLMQRNIEEGEAKEFKVVTLNPGRKVMVSAGWLSSLVNIGKNFLVVLGSVDVDFKAGGKLAKEKRGLAYFVVEKKGEVAFEQNPNYSVHPQITTE